MAAHKKLIEQTKKGKNLLSLEIAEVVLVQYSLVDNTNGSLRYYMLLTPNGTKREKLCQRKWICVICRKSTSKIREKIIEHYQNYWILKIIRYNSFFLYLLDRFLANDTNPYPLSYFIVLGSMQ